MSLPSHSHILGFVLESSSVPSSLPGRLERSGMARLAARTVDGLYIEPLVSLETVLATVRGAGAEVYAARPAGAIPSWHFTVRSAATARQRLSNPLSPTWLPTLPAA